MAAERTRGSQLQNNQADEAARKALADASFYKHLPLQEPNPDEKAKTLTVVKIVHDGDRVILYGKGYKEDPWGYHLIAESDVKVKVGDRVEYKTEGVNFGWFEKVIESKSKRTKKSTHQK
jgi:hypothetical protein